MIHSVAIQNQDPSADAILNFDLAVNPLSVILINLRPLNDTGTTANYTAWLETISSAINRVTIRHRGASIISMTGADAAVMAAMRHGSVPWMANPSLTNNDRILATLPIFMGRGPYDPVSCFPASRAGELTMELDVDVAATGYDDLQFTVETIELLGANPKEYERKIQLSRTFSATGLNDIDLPVGNLVRGALLFGTTPFTGASPAPTWGRISTIADGVAIGYSATDFEVLHGLQALLGIALPPYSTHIHVEADSGGPTEIPQEEGVIWGNHAYLNFDPLKNDTLSVDTSKLSRFQIRSDVGTANAVRVVPVERILL